MRRFFIPGSLAQTMTITGADAHHIGRVLRYQPGQKLLVVDRERRLAEAEISVLGADYVTLRLVCLVDADTEAPIEVILAQCLPKADKMDYIVQKAVELGVSAVYPVESENCVVKYDAAKKAARQKKWQRIAQESAKQCGRTFLPDVMPIRSLREVLADLEADTAALFCYEGEADAPIRDLLESSPIQRFLILIGPEGGFSPAEAALCRSCGMKAATLGPRILRTETAALAAVSIVMYQNGDLGGRR